MSIRLRLTLWYIGLLAVVLGAFSVLLYSVTALSLNAELDRDLDSRRDQVEANSFVLLGSINIPPIDAFSASGVFVQVLSLDGRVLGRSENLGAQTLPHESDVMAAARKGQSLYSTFSPGPRTRFRMLTAPLLIDRRLVGIIQVAGSLRAIEDTLNRLALWLAVGALSALALAALIGYLLAGSALKPIDDITRDARAIAHTKDLDRRVRETHQADEVDRLAITFNEMLQRLQDLFRTQQRFLADVSHELRTPLTIIRGHLAMLAKMDSVGDRQSLQTIDNEAQRMSRLISDLLLLAQSDAGAVTLNRQPVELDTLLLDVYRQARIMAAERDGQLKIVLGDEDQAIVVGDPDRLKQLLLNLVENAIKYTASGEVKLDLRKQDKRVAISVSDTGMGIPAEDLPHVFDRFYRVDKARSREKGGTGLGLAIADWIAKMHEGEITVQSEVGKGSTFTVWLPEKS